MIEDVVLLEDFIRFGCAGTVGAFSHDLDALGHLLDRIRIDLSFDARQGSTHWLPW